MKTEALVALASLLGDVRISLRTLETQIDRAIDALAVIAGDPGATRAPPDHALVIDEARFTVRWDGRECELGQTLLYRLLRRLNALPVRYVTHEDLLEDVWGAERTPSAIRTAVGDLRRRIKAAGMNDLAGAIDGRNPGHYGLRLDRLGRPRGPDANPTATRR
jgi:DNA-binding response OmpR family regulator